ncbi:MAG: amidohydrolase family protein, partial [Flavobacteriaceae bacterium]|nr:amidohydrolase family protein [Eudoraea sp.]NNJ37840.1 amidohydrolase family protein [Flavobacteriaceae bacterium]
MQTKIFVFSLFFLACIMGIGQEMSFEAYNPASTLVVPGKEVPRAKFPFVDIHSHQFRMATQDLSALIADMDKLNLAVMVNLSGRSGEQLAQAVDNVSRNYPNRFVVFANIDFKDIGTPGWTENTVRQLETDVKNGARGLKIYKSLGLRHRDSEGNRVTVDDKRLDPIWAKCGELGIPVLIHSADP